MVGWGRKSYLGPVEIVSFCVCFFFSQIRSAETRNAKEVSRYSAFIFPVDEFIPLFPVLLKELRMLGESKVLSFLFLVLIKGMRR